MVILLMGILGYGAASLFASRDAYSSYIAKDLFISQALLAQQAALGMSATSDPASLTVSVTSDEWRFVLTKGADVITRAQESSGGSVQVDGATIAAGGSRTFIWNSEGNLTSGDNHTILFSGANSHRVCLSASGYAYESAGACP